eukprot:2443829-Pyramimonas_sp.AAC.2
MSYMCSGHFGANFVSDSRRWWRRGYMIQASKSRAREIERGTRADGLAVMPRARKGGREEGS